jgi:hypothetical protein
MGEINAITKLRADLRIAIEALQTIADGAVAFNAHPVGVIETWRGVAVAARERLKASGVWENEVDAEREVRQRSRTPADRNQGERM